MNSVQRDLFERSLDLAKSMEILRCVARWDIADLAEIEQDYETAVLVLSDALHEFIAATARHLLPCVSDP